ncbi:hypothetical protein AVEN_71959-1 [Araneus ventricosus]|uniref:Uncharacterized protein n=1 Tax=Araneus ventricosus TaxID=182803 RepID=A0A4Y2F498_ARAVE|nr:hypothetical protein AVEN_71959-1 [Araneus ventricosus]
MGCNMSLKIHFLHSHLEFYPENLGSVSDEHGEQFHQAISNMGTRIFSPTIFGHLKWIFLKPSTVLGQVHKKVKVMGLRLDGPTCQLPAKFYGLKMERSAKKTYKIIGTALWRMSSSRHIRTLHPAESVGPGISLKKDAAIAQQACPFSSDGFS